MVLCAVISTTTQMCNYVLGLSSANGHPIFILAATTSSPKPTTYQVRHRLSLWLQQHLTIQKKTSPLPLPISSDIIESLFGNFKHILQRSPQADMNRTTLLLPALCGTLDEAAIMKALSHASHAELEDWVSENIPYTLRKKRHEFFHSKKANNRENNSSFLAAISTA